MAASVVACMFPQRVTPKFHSPHIRCIVVGLTPDIVAINTFSSTARDNKYPRDHIDDEFITRRKQRRKTDILFVPANENLVGTLFTPSEAAAAGHRSGIVYAEQTVDGQVHAAGGLPLQTELHNLGVSPIETGDAVITGAPGGLGHLYSFCVHTVPPFYSIHKYDDWEYLLIKSWKSALDCAISIAGSILEEDNSLTNDDNNDVKLEDGSDDYNNIVRIAAPLLGAGARGAPTELALMKLTEAVSVWCLPEVETKFWEERVDGRAHSANFTHDDIGTRCTEVSPNHILSSVSVDLHINLVEDRDADVLVEILETAGWEGREYGV
mmetsp:Transcript_1771/g.2562  ORF Transcript_1771/g.2562 Transcript_1771/m.2562 type:complete len:324 (+) Transcript_1771:86-1057(+)|eukprot:CAMPEP_0185268494 /NCGR_PEP_ID=MMETSP1359-20130426/37173_1 /TAXON_ID=552665 /ORGANISM="Bigelowiella longifila, Strain CCMP242" /LENGTH=323 /DNA_ID=CAMNT_0027859269 /DNA_START=73 /DNA_END=1044 /DNA_ORIENTATION=+